ncbi:MAG: NAD(P)-dependent oxidoreductase [Chitinophagaceae bacterium]|nr:NAD(P)-dependent oxidoreductase [Chitinophagaceae bacterium]
MKILITGANGFIGSYLSKYCLQKGDMVIASSRTFHESTKVLLRGASLIQLDVLNKTELEQIHVEADVIIHTATANDVVSKDTLNGITLSALGTRNILDFAVRNKIPRCVVFSTLQVYGTELNGKITEESPLHYQNDYGLNHVFSEMYAELYARQGKLHTVAVRPSNVYGRILTGSFNRWNLVPGCFCKEALENGMITIKSSGKQMRNFVNLQNLSRAMDCILRNFPEHFECYNLASSQTLSMKAVAETVKQVYQKLYDSTIQIAINGSEPQTSNYFEVSLEKLEKSGFTEDKSFTLESEIEQIFNYLNQTKRYGSH